MKYVTVRPEDKKTKRQRAKEQKMQKSVSTNGQEDQKMKGQKKCLDIHDTLIS